MSIVDVINRVRREPPYVAPNDPFPDNPSVCKVLEPIMWDRQKVEQRLGFQLPIVLVELWNACGGMMLYGDDLWCPGGLVICSPSDSGLFRLNRYFYERKADRAFPGDLIFAEFRSDLELGLIRCDVNASDYGSIEVVSEIGPREEWIKAASSLEEFLMRYMDAHGEKYWTYHYQKELAERAAQQKP